MTGRERVLAFLDGDATDRLPNLPITMQYAAERASIPYKDYATNYASLVDGQLRIAEEFGFDYVNTMSDPACEAADCGAEVRFYPDQPPALDEEHALLLDKMRLIGLTQPDPEGPGRMSNRLRAVRLDKERVRNDLLIEGWIEGPCAEAADLRGINNLMVDFIDDPAFVHDLFAFVLDMELRFASAQVAAGVHQIGIGDAAASLVGPRIYDEFVRPYERQMVEGVKALGARARLHICGNTRKVLKGMGSLGCDIVDLDYPVPVSEGREQMGANQVILGNIDPVRTLRDGTPESVYAAIGECHRQAGQRYIVGAGCEIPRGTPPENVHAMVQYARDHKGA